MRAVTSINSANKPLTVVSFHSAPRFYLGRISAKYTFIGVYLGKAFAGV